MKATILIHGRGCGSEWVPGGIAPKDGGPDICAVVTAAASSGGTHRNPQKRVSGALAQGQRACQPGTGACLGRADAQLVDVRHIAEGQNEGQSLAERGESLDNSPHSLISRKEVSSSGEEKYSLLHFTAISTFGVGSFCDCRSSVRPQLKWPMLGQGPSPRSILELRFETKFLSVYYAELKEALMQSLSPQEESPVMIDRDGG